MVGWCRALFACAVVQHNFTLVVLGIVAVSVLPVILEVSVFVVCAGCGSMPEASGTACLGCVQLQLQFQCCDQPAGRCHNTDNSPVYCSAYFAHCVHAWLHTVNTRVHGSFKHVPLSEEGVQRMGGVALGCFASVSPRAESSQQVTCHVGSHIGACS